MSTPQSNPSPRVPSVVPPNSPRKRLLCTAMTFHLGLRRNQRAQGDDGPRGTFDFKWIPGDTVRIALLDPAKTRSYRQEYALALLRECAERWITRGTARINLRVEVDPDYITPAAGRGKRYDVLASCPRKAASTSAPIQTQSGHSQIGSYARRQDYLTPTLILPLEGPDTSWSADDGFVLEDLVAGMHELGHVLGLPHAHQSPRLGLDSLWQPQTSPAYPAWFAQFGLPAPTQGELEAFIDGDLKSTCWGRVDNSHWWPFQHNQFIDSIMTYPAMEDCLISMPEQRIFGPLLPSGSVAGTSKSELEHWTYPTEDDWRLLVSMYGRAR